MNKTTFRVISLVCAVLMLFVSVGLVACQVVPGTGNDTTTDASQGGTEPGGDATTVGGDETTAGDQGGTTTDGASGDDEPSGTTTGSSGNTTPSTPVDTSWLMNFNEKCKALSNPYGRNMSVAWGGDSVNYPAGSKKAFTEAIAMGADAVGIYVKKTSDGVLVVLPATDISKFTNYNEVKGQNGLPSSTSIAKWTWEQLLELRYLKADKTVSNRKIMSLEDLVVLCKDQCFIYIKNYTEFDDNNYEEFYKIAEKTEGYSAFMMTPGMSVISKWKTAHSSDAKLTAFLKEQTSQLFFHQMDYFDVRTVTNLSTGGYRSDDESGWKAAYNKQQTILVTNKIYDHTQWIAKNFKSALKYTPTQYDNLTFELKKSDLKSRYFVVTDIHYTPVEDTGYMDRVTYRGYSTVERMTKLCQEIEAEYNLRGLDAIIICGDLTTDDYPHRSSGVWLGDLYDTYLDPLSAKLGIPVLAVGGNHDPHPNSLWKRETGNDREFVWENPRTGDVFIMVDSYNPETGKVSGGSGASFTGNNETWVAEQLEKYKNSKNIFICAHSFDTNSTSYIKLLAKYENVKAIFEGHSHGYFAKDLKTYVGNEVFDAGAKYINAGNYAYGDWGYGKDCGPTFDYHDKENVWGYSIVEITDTKTVTYRVDVEAFYCAKYCSDGNTNVRIYQPFTKHEAIVLK